MIHVFPAPPPVSPRDVRLPTVARRAFHASRCRAARTLAKVAAIQAGRAPAAPWSASDAAAVELLWCTGDVAIRHRPRPTVAALTGRTVVFPAAWPWDIVVTPAGRRLLAGTRRQTHVS